MQDRGQFESIAKHHYWLRDIDCSWDEDCYSEPEWQLAWEMWKASRENLVIELPICQFDDGCGDTYDAICVEDMVQALEDQGVKYE